MKWSPEIPLWFLLGITVGGGGLLVLQDQQPEPVPEPVPVVLGNPDPRPVFVQDTAGIRHRVGECTLLRDQTGLLAICRAATAGDPK